MWTRAVFAVSLATLLAIVTTISCGGPDFVIGGTQPNPTVGTQTPTVTCGQTGNACSFGTDCCSGTCDPITFSCV